MVLQDEKTEGALRGTGSRHIQPFVCFRDDLIDYSFHVVGAFVSGELPIRTRTLAHDPQQQRCPRDHWPVDLNPRPRQE